jgi:hypothetical protein
VAGFAPLAVEQTPRHGFRVNGQRRAGEQSAERAEQGAAGKKYFVSGRRHRQLLKSVICNLFTIAETPAVAKMLEIERGGALW